jgi:hypothetical protein
MSSTVQSLPLGFSSQNRETPNLKFPADCSLETSVFRTIATRVCFWEEATLTGAVFQPELIELMRSVLEEATALLPEAKGTSSKLTLPLRFSRVPICAACLWPRL